MVREICIHDNYEGPRSVLESMDVRSTKTKFACARFKDNAASVKVLELLGYLQGAVWGAVVDNDYFPVEFALRALALAYYFGLNLSEEIMWKEGDITSR